MTNANGCAIAARKITATQFTEWLRIGDVERLGIQRHDGKWTCNGHVLMAGCWLVTDSAGAIHVLPADSFEEVCSSHD